MLISLIRKNKYKLFRKDFPKLVSKENLFKSSLLFSFSLHLILFASVFSLSLFGNKYTSSDEIEVMEMGVDISEIPHELICGNKDPAKVEKSEWVEGTGKNRKDPPLKKENENAVSGNNVDGEGFLFAIHGDSPPVPVIRFSVNDFYPQEAKRAKIREKTVLVTVQVEEDGTLKSVRVATEQAGYGFDEAAIKILKLARFRPGYLNGKPVKMNHTLAFKFELE